VRSRTLALPCSRASRADALLPLGTNISDHRPISAGFVITIKSVDGNKRRRAKREVEKMWDARQVELLHQTRDWCSLQAMIV